MPARLPFTIFQGGMPRASYGDRHCISVVHDGQQTAFDFTSRVIDFTVLAEADPASGRWAWEVAEGMRPVHFQTHHYLSPSAPLHPSQCLSLPLLVASSLLATPPTCSEPSSPLLGSDGTEPKAGRSRLWGSTAT